MAYEYASFAGYLRANPHDNLLMILIGDHQPPAAVTGADAEWLVPVHVIGKGGPVLRQLVERGFRPGLTPEHPSIGAMHTLAPSLLDAFGTPAPASHRAGVGRTVDQVGVVEGQVARRAR